MLNLDSLLRIPDVEASIGFEISPNGGRLAFAWNKSGQWEIYEMDLSVPISKDSEFKPACLSSGPGGKVAPRYSPDGNYLAWAVDFDGSESFHLILFDRISGESRDLTPDIAYAIQPFFAWSPDSKQIAYLADKDGNFDLYVCDIDGAHDRLLFRPGGPASFVRWSPAGAHIVVTAEKEWQTDGTFIVPLDGGLVHRIGGTGNPIDAYLPAWSPDGTKVVFSSHSPGWNQIGIYRLDSECIEWLTTDKSDHLNPAWSYDGKQLCWVRVQRETAWVDIYNLENKAVRRIETGNGFCHLPLFTPDNDAVVFLREDPLRPLDIWMACLEDGHLRQLTDSVPETLGELGFVMPEVVHYPSFDETPIPALLYKPTEAGPHSPAVVMIHGGPTWHIGFYWNPIMSYYASRGWTVIAPNYRGSTGYGRDWQVSNRFEMGRLDSDDCAASAQYLVNEKIADPKKIAVTGRSHGGYLTMTCLTRNPDLFAVGSAVVPFLNWFTGHDNSREDLQYWDICNMGDPKEYHDLWYERSPFFFLDRVRAPVQLIAGENDMRCPPSESIAAHEKLKEHGVECELLMYKDEGHGFLKLDNVIDSDVKRVEFLAKVLEK